MIALVPSPARPSRRTLPLAVALTMALSVLLLQALPAFAGTPRKAGAKPARSTKDLVVSARTFSAALGSRTQYASQASAAGMTSAVLQVSWRSAQATAGGGLNNAYLSDVKAQYNRFRAAGLSVILDPGLQYAPDWVLALPGARFVNQYGDVWRADPASGEETPDAIHSAPVRAAQKAYLQALGARFGAKAFTAVRVGGSLTGELRLPPADAYGHTDNWWLYGGAAQAGSPVPGYVPGGPGATQAKDTAFVNYSLSTMAAYQDFLVGAMRSAFTGDLLLMYPSWGIRPGDVTSAVAAGLSPSAMRFSEIAQGVDFATFAARAAGYQAKDASRRYILYTTWLDGPGFGTTATTEPPVAYLARLGKAKRLAVGGENTASSATDRTVLAECVRRVKAYGLVGVVWFDDQSLFTTPRMDVRALATSVSTGATAATTAQYKARAN